MANVPPRDFGFQSQFGQRLQAFYDSLVDSEDDGIPSGAGRDDKIRQLVQRYNSAGRPYREGGRPATIEKLFEDLKRREDIWLALRPEDAGKRNDPIDPDEETEIVSATTTRRSVPSP